MKKLKISKFIGRLEPFHNGHQDVIKTALEKTDKAIILLGSSFRPATFRNPWSFDERKQMIEKSFPNERERLTILPLMDQPYNNSKWVENVQRIVHGVVSSITPVHMEAEHYLIGMEKDHTSFYLKLFPKWNSIPIQQKSIIDATKLRGVIFSSELSNEEKLNIIVNYCPSGTVEYIKDLLENPTERFTSVFNELKVIKENNDRWSDSPYPPIFKTVDNVVIYRNHVLMVTRKNHPGKGLYALPGGYINQYETLQNAAIRELKEETNIAITSKKLIANIKKEKEYDDPYRSVLGRLITTAFLIDLSAEDDFPDVNASDDAETVQWLPLGELEPEKIHDDHYFIIHDLLENSVASKSWSDYEVR